MDNVKIESSSLRKHSLQERFEKLVNEPGRTQVTDAELREVFTSEYPQLVTIINDYLRSRRLQLFQNPQDNSFVYRVQSAQNAKKYEGLDQDHMHVLQEISQSGSAGIWIRSVKLKTRLPQHLLNKVICILEKNI